MTMEKTTMTLANVRDAPTAVRTMTGVRVPGRTKERRTKKRNYTVGHGTQGPAPAPPLLAEGPTWEGRKSVQYL